jgi:hypothetical protein
MIFETMPGYESEDPVEGAQQQQKRQGVHGELSKSHERRARARVR